MSFALWRRCREKKQRRKRGLLTTTSNANGMRQNQCDFWSLNGLVSVSVSPFAPKTHRTWFRPENRSGLSSASAEHPLRLSSMVKTSLSRPPLQRIMRISPLSPRLTPKAVTRPYSSWVSVHGWPNSLTVFDPENRTA